MRLLRLAIEKQRWDLAAHTIVLATAKLLNNDATQVNKRGGEKPDVTRIKKKSSCDKDR